jgi:NAD+ diphosphatase
VSLLAFISSPLDRNANIRSDAALVERRLHDKNVKVLQLSGDGVRMNGTELYTDFEGTSDDLIYLGEDHSGHPWFAQTKLTESAMSPIRPLITEGGVSAEALSIVAQARSMLHWHDRHSFCANCGVKTQMADAGYRRHCATCKIDHFPRTDPVAIMAVRHDGKILLGRQKAWATGMFSALAGFVEPGETIEQAVAREVLEESGIKVGKISYVTSQPWPFPANLMIGCIAEATSTEIKVDEKELEQARWFSHDEINLMLKRKHPENLYASNPYAIAHAVIKAALKG